MEAEELKHLLDKYDNEYYNLDAPTISDEVYDAIKQEYLAISNLSEYDYIPGEALFNRYKHEVNIKSLAKIQVEDKAKLRLMIKKLLPVTIQPKFDGLTLITYEDAISTRGNGEYGEDVMINASTILGIDKLVKSEYNIRGEALIDKQTFKDINESRINKGLDPYKNARNAAAGMLRNSNVDDVIGLSFYAYDILQTDMTVSDQLLAINSLCSSSVHVTNSVRFDDIDKALEYIDSFDRNALPYDIDGLVVKSDQPNSLKKFGETSHSPNNAFAIKFATEAIWTELLEIVNQVGRTGKITPVAIFEPINIMGSIVNRATLNNYAVMNALGLTSLIKKNGRILVKVTKANEIIPEILEVKYECNDDTLLDNNIVPTICPTCSCQLTLLNDQLFCLSPLCKSKLIGNTIHLAKRESLDIEGLSVATIEKLYDSNLLKTPLSIYDLTLDDILSLPGFANKSANNLYHNIQSSKQDVELKNFLYSVAIPNVGRTVSEDLSNHFKTYDALISDVLNNDCKEIFTIEGIGNVIVNSIKYYYYLWEELRMIISPNSNNLIANPNEVYTFVVTGTFDIPRKEIEQQLKDLGHKVSSSVSKNTSALLAGEKAGSKLKKAQDLNITIYNSFNELMTNLENLKGEF